MCSNSKWQGVSFCRFARKMICHFPNQCMSASYILSVNWVPCRLVPDDFHGGRFQSSAPGTYKSEENQLLLKVYQVKGPTQHYISKFKNDNWAMDGYVSDAAGGCWFLDWSFSCEKNIFGLCWDNVDFSFESPTVTKTDSNTLKQGK